MIGRSGYSARRLPGASPALARMEVKTTTSWQTQLSCSLDTRIHPRPLRSLEFRTEHSFETDGQTPNTAIATHS
jgi:hypothetical protein